MVHDRRVWGSIHTVLFGMLIYCIPGYSVPVGNYVSHTQTGNQIEFSTGGTQKVRIYICTPTIARVSFDARGTFTSTKDVLSMADVNRTWPAVSPLTVTDAGATVNIATAEMVIKVQKSPFRVAFFEADGTTQLMSDAAAMESAGTSATNPTFTFTQGANEHFFGWGNAFEAFRRQPGYHQLDNKNGTYSTRRSTACYMYSTGGYGLWFLFAEPAPPSSAWGSISNPTPGTGFDLRNNLQKYWMNPSTDYGLNGAMEYASYFFFKGNWKEAMSGYTLVSGRPPKLGKKFYGYMRDMYYRSGTTIATMRGWADMFRNERFNMDWVRMDNFFDWTNLGYLPNVPNSGCWNNEVEAAVQYYKQKGYYFGGMSAGWGLYGCCSAGCTRNLLQTVSVCRTAIDHGFDWAWYDAMNFQKRQTAKEQWDVWLQAHQNDESKVFISRGWQALSSQAWPGNHMGDYLNSDYIYAVFPSALQEHLVGYAWSHTDLGEGYDFGYIGYTLRPMVSIHMAGAAGGTATNFEECGRINTYAADLKAVMRKWANWHYRFIPFLFTYGMIANETGIPVTRAMVCQNGGEQDPNCWTNDRLYQAYVGEELIWSPYYRDNPLDNNSGTRKNIYIPRVPGGLGCWFDYWDGTKYNDGTTIPSYNCAPAGGRPAMKLPVFVKAGSIVPLMDTLQFIGERAESLITVQVWPTNGGTTASQGTFVLYEDEKPTKTALSFSYAPANQQTTVSIGAFAGSRYCPQAKRIWRVEIHCVPTVQNVMVAGAPLAPISAANYHAGQAGWYWEAANGGVCYIGTTGANVAQGFQVIAAGGAVGVTEAFAQAMRNKISVSRAHGAIRVSVPLNVDHEVEVFNAQGRMIARRNAPNAAEHSIAVTNKTPSMYVVKVKAQGTTSAHKIVL